MKEKQLPYFLMVAALFFGIISHSMFSDGMFVDGVTYSVISKNMAHGLGSFWDLHYTSTLFPHFHEHPPLVFGLQSLLFSLMGDSMLIERIYSLLTFLITALLILYTWKIVVGKDNRDFAWLPLLFWILVPIVTWAAPNNILENTLMIFTGLSVLFILRSLSVNRFLNLSLAGIMLFLGWMSKGFVALFPLSLPLWIYLFKPGGPNRRFLVDTLILTCACLLPFLLMFLVIPESIHSLHAYINQQVIVSLQNAVTVKFRFHILARLFIELIPGLLLIFVIFLFTRKFSPLPVNRRWSYMLIALGLSGVVPIMISMKQRGFYILATYPFFSIALALLILPRVKYLLARFEARRRFIVLFKYTAFTMLIVSLFLCLVRYDRIGRDREMLEDIYMLKEIIPEAETISVSADLWENWYLHAYFHRYGEISLDGKEPYSSDYLLVDKAFKDEPPAYYEKQAVVLHKYELYKR